jgi:fatty-acyl-CoA synthase
MPLKSLRMSTLQISYDHGVSDKKLIGETIGTFFDRTVETYRDREALVVRQQNVRWSWGELGRRVDELAAGLPPDGWRPSAPGSAWCPASDRSWAAGV